MSNASVSNHNRPAETQPTGDWLMVTDGRPLRLFHGTTAKFDRFEVRNTGEKDSGWYGRGVYLTADPTAASAYAVYESLKNKLVDSPGARVIPVHVKLQNPYHWPKGRQAATTFKETVRLMVELLGQGHDGVIVSNEFADPAFASHYEVVAFYPEQVWSAIADNLSPQIHSLDEAEIEHPRP